MAYNHLQLEIFSNIYEFYEMDVLDRKILTCLQEDATLAISDIATKVGLSTTPCWRRIRSLEESGVIKNRVALLDADQLNLGVTVFVAIRTQQHNDAWLEKFATAVTDIPEIIGLYRMAGDVDYLMKVVVPDIDGYDAVYKLLIAKVDLSDVSSTFVMETIKETTALPLHAAR